jgi:hypothetical protein
MVVTYTNYRGETSIRKIIPKSVRWGHNEWHKTDQWLLLALDIDKNADREFALRDFGIPTNLLHIALGHIEHMAAWIADTNKRAKWSSGIYSFESLGEDMPALTMAAHCLREDGAPCAWPDCGCNPLATKIIAALVEQGWKAPDEPAFVHNADERRVKLKDVITAVANAAALDENGYIANKSEIIAAIRRV